MPKIVLTCIFFILLSKNIIARPVSYPGGITFMQMNDTNKNSIHLHYSLDSLVYRLNSLIMSITDFGTRKFKSNPFAIEFLISVEEISI